MCSVTGTKPPVHLPRKAANTENAAGERGREREKWTARNGKRSR